MMTKPAQARYLVYVILGIIGVTDFVSTRKKIQQLERGEGQWWRLHLENMMGAGVAFHTAFLVFGARHLIGELPGTLAFLPWVLPSAVGLPAMQWYASRYGASQRSPGARPARG